VGARKRHGDLQRAVEPGAEAPGEEVVRLRVVWLAGSLPASLEASRSPSAGAASTSISAVAAIAVTTGRRCTRCTHRIQKPPADASPSPPARRLPPSPIRRPAKPK